MSRNEAPKLFTVEMREDDPAKCTSAKMSKFRLARAIRLNQIPSGAIILNPFSPETILNQDKASIQTRGLVVIDCSWVNAASRFKEKQMNGIQRRLPALLAGNPTNYAKIGALSSLEACAAALFITGFHAYAEKLLSLYKWGPTFLSLNSYALNDYEKAKSQNEIEELELDYFQRTKSQ